MSTTLEKQARVAWVGWGSYAGFHTCCGCGQFVYCRAKHYGSGWLCLACHSLKG